MTTSLNSLGTLLHSHIKKKSVLTTEKFVGLTQALYVLERTQRCEFPSYRCGIPYTCACVSDRSASRSVAIIRSNSVQFGREREDC